MASALTCPFPISFLIFLSLMLMSKFQANRLQASFKTRALVFPLRKDCATALHVAYILKRTPQISIPFLLDLNGKFLWVDCEQNYVSSTYTAPFCHSTQCSRAGVHYCHKCSTSNTIRPGCHNNTCFLLANNPLARRTAIGELAQDILSIHTSQGSKTGSSVRIPRFLFACAPSFLLKRSPTPKNIQGIAGFGHTSLALPIQLASHFGFSPVFALCLSSSTKKNGVIFIGNGPYIMRPGIDISRPISYTPLTIGSQGEYFFLVRLIKINDKLIPLKSAPLSGNRAFLRTMISTTTPYTALEHSLFIIFTKLFVNLLSGVPQVKPVSPFEVCFNCNSLIECKSGPGVPKIVFVLQNQNFNWTLFGENSMVQARRNVSCLAFVDGGFNLKASIIIGSPFPPP